LKRVIYILMILMLASVSALAQTEFEHEYVWTAPDTVGGFCPAEGYEMEILEWTGSHTNYPNGTSSFDDTIADTTHTFMSPANTWHRVRVRGWCYGVSVADGDTLIGEEAIFGLYSEWSNSRKQGGPPRKSGTPIRLRF